MISKKIMTTNLINNNIDDNIMNIDTNIHYHSNIYNNSNINNSKNKDDNINVTDLIEFINTDYNDNQYIEDEFMRCVDLTISTGQFCYIIHAINNYKNQIDKKYISMATNIIYEILKENIIKLNNFKYTLDYKYNVINNVFKKNINDLTNIKYNIENNLQIIDICNDINLLDNLSNLDKLNKIATSNNN